MIGFRRNDQKFQIKFFEIWFLVSFIQVLTYLIISVLAIGFEEGTNISVTAARAMMLLDIILFSQNFWSFFFQGMTQFILAFLTTSFLGSLFIYFTYWLKTKLRKID
jgi:hypothetical protein